jgi:hypothetical protein
MKKNTFIPALIAVLLLAGAAMNRACAQIVANDDAGVYTGWNTGTNYGFGFEPWQIYNTGNVGGGAGYGGIFLGNSTPTDTIVSSTNGNYWGMYANQSATAASETFRAFSNSLPVNATFKIRWHNEGIGFSGGNIAGFNLRNGDNTNLQTAASFLNDGSLFSFYFIGGSLDNYFVYDANGVSPVPVSFETGDNEGLTVEVTLLANSMYNLQIENAAGTEVLWSTNDQPLVGGGTIDSVATYVFDAGGNQDFNDMEIFYLAPQIQNLTPANGTIYAPTTPSLSFAVVSAASTISSNNIQLTLNGTAVTGAAWTVIGSGTSSNQVTLNAPLQLNQTYNGTVVATDADGNSSTNEFTFNTWVTETTNIYIEASDYNYSGGQWVNNIQNVEPNQTYGQNDLMGVQGIDYNVYNLQETNVASPYRMGDAPFLEPATDVDHDNFASDGFTPYDLGYNDFGQWEDYTRQLSNNVTYAVYARMSGFGANAIMQLERMSAQEVSTASQPGATLGQFNVPDVGGAQNWTFVPLTDFFGNPVQVNFGNTGTNTFRITDIGGNGVYNVSYMLLVALTNQTTLRPYLTSGFPFPGAGGVNPEQSISFTIANRQTSVNPASIQLFINSSNVTSSLTLSNNNAGTVVTYQPVYPNLLQGGANTAEVIFSDGSALQTNTWQFTAESVPVLPTAWALPLTGSYSRGFSEQIAKGDDSATNIDFMPNVARAVAQLDGTLTNSQTGVPYANEALNNGVYIETNTINYAIDSQFDGLFAPTNMFPDIPPGTTNNVAMAADMYVLLSPGLYNFDVYSDDGFEFTAGSTPASTNEILGIANFGRAPTGTEFSFIVQTNGLYPMQLIYFKAQQGGGGVELYSINATNNVGVLLNQSSTPGAVQVYYSTVATAPVLSISLSGNNAVLSWTNPAYSLQSAPAVTGPYTTILDATSPYPVPISGTQEYFRLAH